MKRKNTQRKNLEALLQRVLNFLQSEEMINMLKEENLFNMSYIKINFDFTDDKLNDLYSYAKLLYTYGQYQSIISSIYRSC